MEMELQPLPEQQWMYTYSQSQQISMQTGNIGYLRADFDTDGNVFYSSWNDFNYQLKSDAFRTDLDHVINALRSD